ncbi:uncharacterized protein METZ01_LOCUS495360 [marine metagenome]|uniref:Uncharacterized protein n=1 Tax=marine metagenome TaxID=408172 RepID=A0A383DDC7_9ZZZZ
MTWDAYTALESSKPLVDRAWREYVQVFLGFVLTK